MFKNAGEPWTENEDNQLNRLYNVDMLDIMEISKIHCRAPGGILSRLKLFKYITHRQLARGYDLYKKSNFYKQAIQINKENYIRTEPGVMASSLKAHRNKFLHKKTKLREARINFIEE